MKFEALHLNENGRKSSDEIEAAMHELYKISKEKDSDETYVFLVNISMCCLVTALCNTNPTKEHAEFLLKEVKRVMKDKLKLYKKHMCEKMN